MDKTLSFDEIVNLNHPPKDEPEDQPTVVEQAAAAPAAAAEPKTEQAEDPDQAGIEGEQAQPIAAEAPSHDRKIVKAARAGERAAIRRAEAAEAELLRVKALLPAEQPKTLEPEVLADVERYAPEAASFIKDILAERDELLKKQPKPVEAIEEPEFVPERLENPEVQDVVDSLPELSAWQMTPEGQDNWNRAKQIDTLLRESPKWKGKPLADRLAEVIRMRKDELGEPSTPEVKKPTAADALAKIRTVAKTAPVSVSDVRGKSKPTTLTSKRAEWAGMTNEQLLAAMPED
jgi:hypothetical protein